MIKRSKTIENSAVDVDGTNWSEMHSAGHEVGMIEVLANLAFRKGLIAKVTGGAMLAGVTLSFILPVKYTAVTKLMPPQQAQSSATMMMNQLVGSGVGSLAAMAGGGLGLKNPSDIYVGLLQSRPVEDAIIQRFGLTNVYHSRDMTAARLKLKNNTEIVSEKSGLISVSVIDRDRQRSAAMANSYTEQLRALTQGLAMTEASQRRIFYEEQLRQAKDALTGSELAFEQVQHNKGLVSLEAQSRAMIESLTALRAKVAAKEVEVQGLRSYSTDRNPDVQMAERELSSLQAEVESLEQSNHSSGFTDLGMKDIPSAGLNYLNAQHEVLYRQTLFDLLIKQFDAAKLDEAKEAVVIQVVEPAIEPDRRSSPKRALIGIATTIIGFLFGCLLALILRWFEVQKSDPIMANRLMYLRSALRVGRGIQTTGPSH
jgi:tyrosine-protein kinase Etk/Wzc